MQEAALTNTRARTGKGALYAAARIDGARRRTAELPRSWAGRNDAVVIVDFWPSCVCLWKPLMKNPEIVGRVAYSGVKESLTRVSNMRRPDEQALYEKRKHVALSNMGRRGGINLFKDARIGPDAKPLRAEVIGDIGNVLWVLMGSIGMVLLIVCANART